MRDCLTSESERKVQQVRAVDGSDVLYALLSHSHTPCPTACIGQLSLVLPTLDKFSVCALLFLIRLPSLDSPHPDRSLSCLRFFLSSLVYRHHVRRSNRQSSSTRAGGGNEQGKGGSIGE